MSDMPLDEAIAKARDYSERDKSIPSVSRALLAAYDELAAERDALQRQCEVHKQDAMREIEEANDLAAKCDALRAERDALAAALGTQPARPAWEREPPHCPTCDCPTPADQPPMRRPRRYWRD